MGVMYHEEDEIDGMSDVSDRNLEAAYRAVQEAGGGVSADSNMWEIEGILEDGAYVLLSARYEGELDLTCTDSQGVHYNGMMCSGEIVRVSNERVTVKTMGRY